MFLTLRYEVLAALVAVGMAPSVSAKEIDLGNQLPPMAKPALPAVGYTVVGKGLKGATRFKAIGGTGQVRSYRDHKGCEWVRDGAHGYFAPNVRWQNCGGKDGQIKFNGLKGNIWPLAVGKSVTYKATGRTDSTWSATRRCKVQKQVRITTHTGTHDTFKVVCRTKWSTQTHYMSPRLGRSVKFVREPTAAGTRVSRARWELTRVEQP